MGAFWADAENLFDTACRAGQSGSPDCDWAILVGARGGIHVVEATGWVLASLLSHHGAAAAYRVTRAGGRVRLEGRSGSTACLLTQESPADAARHLLNASPAGYLTGPLRLAASPRPPAREWV